MCSKCAFPFGCCVILACLIATACQNRGGVIEQVDDETGLTIVTNPEPMAFARADSRLSRSARDYVFVGPVEVSDHGVRQYYLWVAVASTIDRVYLQEAMITPDIIYIDLADQPMAFRLEPWGKRLPELADTQVYEPAVKPAAVLAGRITLDQLLLLAHEDLTSLKIAEQSQPGREYFLWKEGPPWPEFARYGDSR
jgi:hypothetical protein